MQPRLAFRCALILTLLVIASPAAMEPFQLSGKVFGGGAPLPNTTVEAIAGASIVAATRTDAAGSYSLSLANGTYDLRVTPPAGSGFGVETVQGVTIAGADRQYDVILVAPSGMVQGVMRGYGGAPVANVTLQVYTTNWQFITSATTDADGKYSLAVGTGKVILHINAPYSGNSSVPDRFYFYHYNFPITASMTLDFDLPVVKVRGVIKGPDGAPLAGATVQVDSNHWNGQTQMAVDGYTTVTTDATGAYEALAFTGTATMTVRPPAGVEASIVSDAGIMLTSDLQRDVTLPAASVVTGVIRGYGGAPVANVTLQVYTTNWQFITSATTDATGKYSLAVGAGTVILHINAPYSGNSSVPDRFYFYHYNFPITASMTLDFDLPVVQLRGTVTDSNGAPIPGVTVETASSRWDGQTQTAIDGYHTVTTGPSGSYEALAFAGTATITVRPPSSTGFAPVSLSGLSLAGDVTQRVILQRPDLSPPQIVAGPVVVHLSDTSVSVSWTTNEPATSIVEYGIGSTSSVSTLAGLSTLHEVTLTNLEAASTYSFRVGSSDGSNNGPTYSSVGTFATQAPPGDETNPVITDGPTVVFVDQTKAIIQWSTDEPATSRIDYGLTDALGTPQSSAAGLFTRSHSLEIEGLSADTEYFARISSADPDGNSAASSLFSFRTLAVPDNTAPVITEGPAVVSVTDTKVTVAWTTNEPATSGVSYNDGTQFFVVSDTALTREHEVTLSGLTPQTVYFITVSSTDAAGNGPTLDGPIEGATASTPDTAAPAISDLAVEDVTETTAVVKWTTSEPATSAVDYGTASAAYDGTRADVALVTEHSLVLTGLRDGTKYYATVSSVDASGNRATSVEIDFTTVSAFIDMPPTAPGPITAPMQPTAAASIAISWGASADDLGVTGYALLRDGEVIAELGNDITSYEDAAPEGTHTYVVRATDTAGHSVSSEPAVVIVDRTAPIVSVPDDIVVDAVRASAPVAYEAAAFDAVDGAIPVTCAPPSGEFPVGETTVVCVAADRAGNEARESFTITVRDVTPPQITSIAPSQEVLWTPNHKMVDLTLAVAAADFVDANPVCSIESIASNEPENGLGDGDTAPDWTFSGLNFALRAERAAQGSGRVYTITATCADAAGNASTATTTVRVPKSQR